MVDGKLILRDLRELQVLRRDFRSFFALTGWSGSFPKRENTVLDDRVYGSIRSYLFLHGVLDNEGIVN